MHLPPQAYTKETLIQAYNWLRSQPPHVQELAKSPDVLVALYSKAQMHGENYLNRTNLQGFKSELKNLASIMGDFDESQIAAQAAAQTVAPPTKAGASSKGSTAASSAPPSANNHQAALAAAQAQAQAQQAHANAQAQAQANASMNSLVPHVVSGMMATPSVPSFTSLAPDPGLPLFNAMVNAPPGQDLRSVLDQRSWTMIQEVKNHFNLSSETEAVRLLIAMGYQKMRSQF